MLSTHKVEVVEVKLQKHPNADTLSVCNVFNGYPCCVRSAEWADGDMAAYVPPDSIVDTSRPEFAFLAKAGRTKHRVKCVKLRGVQSYGLLIKAPEGAKVGDDVAEQFGIEHYESEIKGAGTGGEAEPAPDRLSHLSKYDVDSMRRYASIFEPGETVQLTEKIHGANARFAFMDDRMWCGSRTEWKRKEEGNLWWQALAAVPTIEEFCRKHSGCVLYGEVYGNVQNMKYGHAKTVTFAAFDVLRTDGSFESASVYREMAATCGVPLVPLLATIPYDFEAVCAYAEGPSLVPGADHIREGCVVKPMTERFHQAVGRVILKVVGAGYLEL